ncbi:MAG: AEC family transporter, partial [Lentisphaeria bacterium]
GLPALLFYKIAEASPDLSNVLNIVLVLIAGMIGGIIIGYIVSLLWGLTVEMRGTFVQGAFRGNLAYVGLPVVLYTIESSGMAGDGMAFLAIAPLIPLYNFASVFVLTAGRRGKNSTLTVHIGKLAFKIVTNPLIIACLAGLGYSLSGFGMPLFLHRTCATIGQMALPLALLGIGASLSFDTVKGKVRESITASLIKTGGAPLCGFFVGTALQLSSLEMRVALLYLACPTAVASYVMAQQMNGDDCLAAGIVVVSTIFAVFSLWAVLMFA